MNMNDMGNERYGSGAPYVAGFGKWIYRAGAPYIPGIRISWGCTIEWMKETAIPPKSIAIAYRLQDLSL